MFLVMSPSFQKNETGLYSVAHQCWKSCKLSYSIKVVAVVVNMSNNPKCEIKIELIIHT